MKSNNNNNIKKSINITNKIDNNLDNNSNNNFDLFCSYNKNCETNNNYYIELEEIRLFLYCYFFISIIVN